MVSKAKIEKMKVDARHLTEAKQNDTDLGPLKLLPGVWKNEPNLPGRGWNSIALPFATEPKSKLHYRLLVNQYNETLTFDLVDKGVPNRGINLKGDKNTDQVLVAMEYSQNVVQIASEDRPKSGLAGTPGTTIHHEPGLWLYMLNEKVDDIDIARLSTVPHGDSILALGKSAKPAPGAPVIPKVNGLPQGTTSDLDDPYLEPYKHYHDNPFEGIFDPVFPAELLELANKGVKIKRTTTLDVDTELSTGGIDNIPFVVKQANASAMKSIFWIQELEETDSRGKPKLRLQYLQTAMLDFDGRTSGLPGRIRWPHVSINTLEKVEQTPEESRLEVLSM